MSNFNALPEHIAVIMDGNGRWATRRRLSRAAGHRAGAEAVRRVVRAAKDRGIKALTLFAFSSENWNRPSYEVKLIMELFSWSLSRELKRLHEENIQVEFIGDFSRLTTRLRNKLLVVTRKTANNTGMKLVIAINYGGRWDITQAAQKLCQAVQQGELTADQVDEDLLASQLSTVGHPVPDLLIRTSGELRISNFLIWQLAYSELYFSDVLWPDFDEAEFDKALASFKQRERRYGKTSEQVQALKLASN